MTQLLKKIFKPKGFFLESLKFSYTYFKEIFIIGLIPIILMTLYSVFISSYNSTNLWLLSFKSSFEIIEDSFDIMHQTYNIYSLIEFILFGIVIPLLWIPRWIKFVQNPEEKLHQLNLPVFRKDIFYAWILPWIYLEFVVFLTKFSVFHSYWMQLMILSILMQFGFFYFLFRFCLSIPQVFLGEKLNFRDCYRKTGSMKYIMLNNLLTIYFLYKTPSLVVSKVLITFFPLILNKLILYKPTHLLLEFLYQIFNFFIATVCYSILTRLYLYSKKKDLDKTFSPKKV